MLALLHLCDSLFPLGGFAHSDGLETATASGAIRGVRDLEAWADVVLHDVIGRLDGPTIWQAWSSIASIDEPATDGCWDRLCALDEDVIALRPSASARRATVAMGQRLAAVWQDLHPHPLLAALHEQARRGSLAPTLPIAFAAACYTSGAGRAESLEAFAYTRLAATISAAMRLAPVGQTDAHRLLARLLERLPQIVAAIAQRDAPPMVFMPAADVAAMSQQYLHSRLFRS